MSLSGPVQCTICHAQANQKVPLVHQGWISIVATASYGMEWRRFVGRACPHHHEALMMKLHDFFSQNGGKCEDKPGGRA